MFKISDKSDKFLLHCINFFMGPALSGHMVYNFAIAIFHRNLIGANNTATEKKIYSIYVGVAKKAIP